MLKLIADSGSTKTDWSLLADGGEVLATCHSQGLNPYHLSEDEILRILRDEVKKSLMLEGRSDETEERSDELNVRSGVAGIRLEEPLEIFFYGSGVTEAMVPKMERLLVETFSDEHRVSSSEGCAEGCADVQAHAASDMLGAARALLGHEAGIAVILGTGSNSCWYDGEKMQQGVPPLGYILGDEGSGTAIGKAFLRLILRHPEASQLKEDFFKWSKMDYAAIIDRIYRQPLANTYLASISTFVGERLVELEKDVVAGVDAEENKTYGVDAEETKIYGVDAEETKIYGVDAEEAKLQYELLSEMVEMVYWNFALQILSHYEKGTVGFVGSIAYYFQKYISTALQASGFTMGKVLRSPMEGLIDYHKNSAR